MGQEGRKFRRFAIDIMKIHGKMMFASTVDIIDISLGGISLHTDRSLRIGCEYMLGIKAKDRSISAKATVVWSTLRESRKTAEGDIVPLYSVGMKFNNLDSDKNNDLLTFIESHKEEQDSIKLHSLNDLRVNMRFHLAANGDSILTCPEDFSVKKISLGGMLIETEHALELGQQLPMEVSLQGDNEISFTGRIVSCIPIEPVKLKQFAIGIEFLNMPEETIDKLTGFIKMFL